MILDDQIVIVVLNLVSQAAAGRPGVQIRKQDVASLTPLDPAVVVSAIDALINAGMLSRGATDDRVSLTPAGLACAGGHG